MLKMTVTFLRLSLFGLWLIIDETVSLNVEFQAKDEAGINESIGNLIDRLSPSILQYQHEIKFITMSNKDSQYFSVNQFTGLIKIVKKIDREKLCPSLRHCSLTFSVNCLHQHNIQEIIEVKVVIQDINDNGCQFIPSNNQVIKWRENMKPDDTSEFINRPNDPDVDYGIKREHIRIKSSDSNNFRLKISKTGSILTPFNLELVLANDLDYESRKIHYIVIEASDGIDSHACHLNVTVQVEDINDNSPKFKKSIYRISIPEDYPLNKSIIQLTAVDIDSGIHGQIFYNLDIFSDHIIKENFYVDKYSGNVYLKKLLNYYESSHYLLTIQARNIDMKYTTVKLEINVTDINNNAPKITIHSITGDAVLSIRENERSEKEIGTVSVTDNDQGINAKVNCFLMPLHKDGYVELRKTRLDKTFMVMITKTIDREKIPFINVTLVCNDMGQPTRTTSRNVSIIILDENDNGPIFLNKIWSKKVYEDTEPSRKMISYRIHQFKATDKDVGNNSKLTFSITSHDPHVKEMLEINPQSGILKSNGQLDREITDTLIFRVVVSDNGYIPNTAEKEFRLVIKDYNDHTPTFSRLSKYSFQVCENKPANESVGRILVTDDDYDNNGLLDISIETTGSSVPFAIISRLNRNYNRYTREREYKYEVDIVTTQMLDRESIKAHNDEIFPIYTFFIKAQDKGKFRLTRKVAVEVEVLDENDEAPIFDFATRNISVISLSYYESVNYNFGKVHAKDNDNGLNSTIQYSIQEGNIQDKIYLDSKSGDLHIAKKLTSLDEGDFNLLIVAKDMGSPAKSSSILITVTVNGLPPKGQRFDGHYPNMDSMNLYIIVTIVIASFIISVVLLVAICVVLQKSKTQQSTSMTNKYSDSFLSPGNGYGIVSGDLSIANFHAAASSGGGPPGSRSISRAGSFTMLPLQDGGSNYVGAANMAQHYTTGSTFSNMLVEGCANDGTVSKQFDNYNSSQQLVGGSNDFFRIVNPAFQYYNNNEEGTPNSNDIDSGKGDSVDARTFYNHQQQQQQQQLEHHHHHHQHHSTSVSSNKQNAAVYVSGNYNDNSNSPATGGFYPSTLTSSRIPTSATQPSYPAVAPPPPPPPLSPAHNTGSKNDFYTIRKPLISFCKPKDQHQSGSSTTKVIEHTLDMLDSSSQPDDNSSIICNINSGSFV